MLVDSTVPIIFSGTMRLADRVWVLPSPWGQSKTATEAGLGQAQSRAEHPGEGLATAIPNITWNSGHEVKQTKWQHIIRQLSISRRWNFVDTRGQINEKVKAYKRYNQISERQIQVFFWQNGCKMHLLFHYVDSKMPNEEKCALHYIVCMTSFRV